MPQMKRVAGHSDLSLDHWTHKSQWNMPTEKVYTSFQRWAVDNAVDAFKKSYDKIKLEYDKIKLEYDKIKLEFYNSRGYFDNTHDNMNNVWHFQKASQKERVGHPTPKPIALCERGIKSSSREGETVLDFFGGGGSTMVAGHQINRNVYMNELEEKWCQTIVDRMLKLDPEIRIFREGKDETSKYRQRLEQIK